MYFDSSVLESVAEQFKKTNADVVYGHIIYVDSKNISQITRVWKTGPLNKLLVWLGWIMPHPAVFVRKRVYDEIGVFNTTYRKSADYDFLIRMIHSQKYKIVFLDKFLARMRIGGVSDGTITARIYEWGVTAHILKTYYKIYPFWIFITRPLLKVHQFFKKSDR